MDYDGFEGEFDMPHLACGLLQASDNVQYFSTRHSTSSAHVQHMIEF